MTYKIVKSGNEEANDFEKSIAQALLELEVNSELKPQLRDLHITRAREIEFGNKKVINNLNNIESQILTYLPFLQQAVIINVPMPKQKAFQKIQTRLVRELEKKFSGKHVVFIGDRKILPKPTRKTRNPLKQKRPRSRTLTAVYDAILDDLVFPAEIVGKRVRVKLDGSQLIKVHLDKNQQTTIEHKVSTYFTDLLFYRPCVFWLIILEMTESQKGRK